MIVCPKCNAELEDDTKFCGNCGSPIYETIFCPNCGEQTSSEFAFCEHCGAAVGGQPAVTPAAAASAAKKKVSPTLLIAAVAGCAAIALLVMVVPKLFSGGKSENVYSLYMKDREIFYNDLKKKTTPLQMTSQLIDADKNQYSNKNLADSSSTLGRYIHMSQDGKLLFFPDKISTSSGGFNLYYKEIHKSKAEAVKIDSDIVSYTVNDAATIVTYLKDGNLYQYKIAKDTKDKIAGNI